MTLSEIWGLRVCARSCTSGRHRATWARCWTAALYGTLTGPLHRSPWGSIKCHGQAMRRAGTRSRSTRVAGHTQTALPHTHLIHDRTDRLQGTGTYVLTLQNLEYSRRATGRRTSTGKVQLFMASSPGLFADKPGCSVAERFLEMSLQRQAYGDLSEELCGSARPVWYSIVERGLYSVGSERWNPVPGHGNPYRDPDLGRAPDIASPDCFTWAAAVCQ